MIRTQKQWLGAVPWEKVLEINNAFCQGQSVDPQANEQNYPAARQLWESGRSRTLSLQEALELCRECREKAPFIFNNANTFAGIAKGLMDDWAKRLPNPEAQILRGTVSHYVAGVVSFKEVLQVMRFFERQLAAPVPAPTLAAPVPAPANPSVQSGAA